jgi:general stress protein YciG
MPNDALKREGMTMTEHESRNGHESGAADRGFAAMEEKRQREIARKGGQAVSQDRQHMSEIGRRGGISVSKNREHMAEIGRRGGGSAQRGATE